MIQFFFIQISITSPYHNAYLNIAMTAAEIPPATGNVSTQARKMFLNNDQSTLPSDRTRPTVTIEPTLQWVVEIGRPSFEATKTVMAAPISIQKPLKYKSPCCTLA